MSTPKPRSSFELPSEWKNIPPEDYTRLNVNIPTKLIIELKRICPTHGIISFVTQHTFNRLVNALVTSGTSYPDSVAFIKSFICDGTNPCADRQVSSRHEPERAESVRPTPPHPANLSTLNAESTPGGRRKRGTRTSQTKAVDKTEGTKGRSGKKVT